MSYSDFKTMEEVKNTFHITVNSSGSLFSSVLEIQPRVQFTESLTEQVDLALNINTEKARSEFIIAPLLLETRRLCNREISLFSGTEFNVDAPRGLVGFCDFLVSKSPDQVFLESPIICVVEAKNENIKSGYAQCATEMLAAQLFNERKARTVKHILGVVTTGSNWKFLKLEQDTLLIDFNEYLISHVGKILGILVATIRDS